VIRWSVWISMASVLAGCTGKKDPASMMPPPAPVQVATAEMRDVPLYFEAIGVIKAARCAEVRPQVQGIIKKIHFTEGEWVGEGTLLYTLDETAYAIRVQEVKAQLDQDLAHLNNHKKKLERYKSLTKRDLISQVEWDELETEMALSASRVKADEARLAAAELDLMHCQVSAPIAGFTGKSVLQEGNMAGNAPLVTVMQTEPLLVDFSITEREALRVNTVSPHIEVYAAGGEERLALGKVTFLDQGIDPQSGMLSARATVTEPFKSLRPGQSVRVHLYFGKRENAVLIPLRAVKTNQEGPYVFAIKEDQTVEVRRVRLGAEEKGFVVIEEGVGAEEKVVTEGHLRLFPGSKVEVAKS